MQQDASKYRCGIVTRATFFSIAAGLGITALILVILTLRDGYLAYTQQMPSWDVALAAWQVTAPIIGIVAIGLLLAAWFVCRVANRKTAA